MARSREMATYVQKDWVVENGKLVLRDNDLGLVRVMARAEGYAMVRKKGGMAFAVREKDLRAAPRTAKEAK